MSAFSTLLGKLEFASGLGPELAAILFFVCAGLVIFFYLRVYTYLGGPVVWLLIALRVLAIATLLVLIFRPVLSYQEKISHRMRLYVLLDSSRSMSVNDAPNSPNRLAEAIDRVKNHLDALQEGFRLSLYTFDTTLKRQEGNDWPKPDGAATNIIRPLKDIVAEAPRADTAGIVLMSDGIHNAGGDVLAALHDLYSPPIYTVAMGSTLAADSGFQDIAIERVDAPQEAVVDNIAEVKVSITQTGLADRAIRVELREGEQVLDSKQLVLARGGPQRLTLTFTPTAVGRHKYEVFVRPDPEERISQNNSHTVNILVTSPRIRVLYVEGVLRPEFRAINRVLQTDPNVEVVSLVQIRPGGKFTQLGGLRDARVAGFPQTREDVDKFDVFIIGSLDRTYLSAVQMNLLKEAVREGKGFLMIGGQTSFGPGGYEDTPIEEILPVSVGPRSIGQEGQAFVMKLTPEGLRHPILSGLQEFFDAGEATEEQKPLLTGCVVLGAAKPGASVLAVHPERKGPAEGNLIVLAVQQYGSGRSAAFAGDTTWRWDLPLRVVGAESPYIKFWGQMVRWLAGREVKERATEAGVDLVLPKPFYDLGEKVAFSVQVREEEGRATDYADVTGVVIAPDNSRIPLSLVNVPGVVGGYEAEFTPAEPGDYQIMVEARKEGERLGLAQSEFAVGRPDQEFERLSVNEELLKAIAEMTGGGFYKPANFGDLVESLRAKTVIETPYREFPLYGPPVLSTMFAVFLGLITVEWLIRRYCQLK